MLIQTSRHTKQDLEVWRKHNLKDKLAVNKIDRYERQALQILDCVDDWSVAVSWGRDSVVVAHLACQQRSTPKIWRFLSGVKPGRRENPDTDCVRDLFLADYPDVFYSEIYPTSAIDSLQKLDDNIDGMIVTGVRADESRTRRISKNVHGYTTNKFVRPIIDWPSWVVWAYLEKYGLPVHPAYGYTNAGLFSRDKIRVHTIGGEDGADHGRREWEERYYPDELRAALNSR